MKLTLEVPTEPLRHGWPSLLSLQVHNDGTDLLVPRALEIEGAEARLSWRKRPWGTFLYHAGRDAFRFHTAVTAQSPVEVREGIIQPNGVIDTMFPLKPLGTGQASVTLRITSDVIPAAEAAQRLYLPPQDQMRNVLDYERVDDPELLLRANNAVVQLKGLEQTTSEVTVELPVDPDADDPCAQVLEAHPGTTLHTRCRRLGGAWVLVDDAQVHVVRGERTVTLDRAHVALEPFVELDYGSLPPEPVLIRFLGAAADGLRAKLGVSGTPGGQDAIAPANVWGLLEGVRDRGLRLEWGRHTAINAGLIVR